jgi:hypothetical protein
MTNLLQLVSEKLVVNCDFEDDTSKGATPELNMFVLREGTTDASLGLGQISYHPLIDIWDIARQLTPTINFNRIEETKLCRDKHKAVSNCSFAKIRFVTGIQDSVFAAILTRIINFLSSLHSPVHLSHA